MDYAENLKNAYTKWSDGGQQTGNLTTELNNIMIILIASFQYYSADTDWTFHTVIGEVCFWSVLLYYLSKLWINICW